MKNTTLRLKPEQIEGLKQLAGIQDRKPAEIFRFAVDEYLKRNLPRAKRQSQRATAQKAA